MYIDIWYSSKEEYVDNSERYFAEKHVWTEHWGSNFPFETDVWLQVLKMVESRGHNYLPDK